MRHLSSGNIIISFPWRTFAPAGVLAAAILGAFAVLFCAASPDLDIYALTFSAEGDALKELFDAQLENYKDSLSKIDLNLKLQGILLATAILVIVRKSDSLDLFGNSVPLSWLHFIIPILLAYLWLAFGYYMHTTLLSRLHGIAITEKMGSLGGEYRYLFRDAGIVDGWFVSFIDQYRPDISNLSGIDRKYALQTKIILVSAMATFIGLNHAASIALISIGIRRYSKNRRNFLLYCTAPLLIISVYLLSHFLFAYGGKHPNTFQLYVGIISVVATAFFLFLSSYTDVNVDKHTLVSLQRNRYISEKDDADLLPPISNRSTQLKSIVLIGDSLSNYFTVSSIPTMLSTSRTGWKKNWFSDLSASGSTSRSIVSRLSDRYEVSARNLASVSAKVHSGYFRGVADYLLGTYHLSHQVDEVIITGTPDMVVLWIGHNDVNWRRKSQSILPEHIISAADEFVLRYEIQLRRMMASGISAGSNTKFVVFGLIDFSAFFLAREIAEAAKSRDRQLFPYLEKGFDYFESMRPLYRGGMIELGREFNVRLAAMCARLHLLAESHGMEVIYSDAMYRCPLNSSDSLHPTDAWHGSLMGHSMLADAAYPIIEKAFRPSDIVGHKHGDLQQTN